MEKTKKEIPKITVWQKKLLPFMIAMLAGLTLFFFIASLIQIHYLHTRIKECPELDLASDLKMLKKIKSKENVQERLEYVRWISLAKLEEHALKRRYHQANVLLMSRIWTRYLGFVTGMILALVGAAFILGKLREPETKLDAEGLWKFSITTASPGLILALLGTILMVTTIVTHHEIETKDVPTYTLTWLSPTPPEPLEETKVEETDDDILEGMQQKSGSKKQNE
jgi:hypothetical protein